MNKADIGFLGLGVMGKSLATNAAQKGFSVAAYNRLSEAEKDAIPSFLEMNVAIDVQGFTDLKPFVTSLALPRKILLMIPAGKAVDQILEVLSPLLSKGDIIMDGGNSHFEDTRRRFLNLRDQEIHYLGIGISGGEAGALSGPAMMIGGTSEAYSQVQHYLEAMAAKDAKGNPCAALLGPDGSGHFVKTIHNGIEYAEMQLLAECYALLKLYYTNLEIAHIFKSWNTGSLQSYLLNCTIEILTVKEGDDYLLDKIVDKANSKGTGSWSSQAAAELGVPASLIHAAVTARAISMRKEDRTKWAAMVSSEKHTTGPSLAQLKEAYTFSRLINHHQGFELLSLASEVHAWNLNLSEVARIWTSGCILKSALLRSIVPKLAEYDGLLEHPATLSEVIKLESSLKDILKFSIKNRIATPCMSNSLQYFISMTTAKSPANLIQAQRDYFGAHTFQKTDAPDTQFFTSKWKSNG